MAFSKETSEAAAHTSRGISLLSAYLLDEIRAFEYVLPIKLQSDKLEKKFPQEKPN